MFIENNCEINQCYQDYLEIRKKVNNSSAIYEGEPIDFVYQPILFDKNDLDKFKVVCKKFIKILKKVIKKYRVDPEFRGYFDFTPVMEELILIDPGYEIEFPMARFDIFYNGKDYLKFCELNTDGSSGMNEERVLQNLFLQSSVLNEMKKDYNIKIPELFGSWVDAIINNYNEYKKNYNKSEEKPCIAIVDFRGEGVESEFGIFQNKFQERGFNTIICDPRELSYDGKKLYYDDFQVDLIYRRVTTGKFIEKFDDVIDLVNAYRDHNVCIVGGFVSQLVHNKLLFAILQDREKVNFLTEDEHDFINKYIPCTFILDNNKPEQINKFINNKDNYVLKPFDRYACQGVYPGKDCTDKQWQKVLEDSVKQKYLVQEFCEVPETKMLTVENNQVYYEKYNYTIGLFLYNQQFKGFYIRAGRENIIGALGECFILPAFIIKKD